MAATEEAPRKVERSVVPGPQPDEARGAKRAREEAQQRLRSPSIIEIKSTGDKSLYETESFCHFAPLYTVTGQMRVRP